MYGRYSITTPPEAMARLFGLTGALPNFPARYNIAPGQEIPAIISSSGGREPRVLRWGLVSPWAKAKSKPLINACCESVNDKPSFREAFVPRGLQAPAFLRPAPDDRLRACAVTTRVNRVANDGPENIAPAGPDTKNAPKQGNLF